jgi:1-acyl-sn-glycerol-3-phosphate acyltransferase
MAIPLILLRFKNQHNNRLYSYYFGPVARFILGWRLDISGRENLLKSQPCIYVANHQSSLDIATFTGVFPPAAVLIGKKELRYIPFWGLMFEAFGNILINRKNRTDSIAGLNEALVALREKKLSIFLFPEGTRNSKRGLLPFKKGAFHMAIQGQVAITPIVCPAMDLFFDLPKRRLNSGIMAIEVLEPISTEGLTPEDLPELMERTRSAMLSALDRVNSKSRPLPGRFD